MTAQPVRLCIISRCRGPLPGGHFVAALHASLGSEDQLQIIMDRRLGGSLGESDLTEDRRRHRQVALALEVNGFAIVPASIDPPQYRAPSVLRFEAPIERSPVEDYDEDRLESIRNFQRQRTGTLIPKLIGVLSGVVLGALVVLLAGLVPWQSLWNQLFTGPLSGRPDRPPVQIDESVAGTPPPARQVRESSPRDLDRITPRPRETRGPSEVTSTAPREPIIASRANEPAAPPQAGTGKNAREVGPKPGATARRSPSAPPRSNQVAAAPPSGPATSKAPSTQVVGSPRAELVSKPVSRGWGDSYAVRLLDAAGQPMADARVQLVAHMADGTVENVAMGALTEPGTYRGTVPTNRSTPVDLRLRVTTGDGSVELPVRR
jgi:tetrahydromethanopterin S-methyltransferase subunit G